MPSAHLPIESFVRIPKQELQQLLHVLAVRGYRTVGPRVVDGAIVYDDLHSVSELPVGQIDEQDGGRYRLRPAETQSWFDYVVGPHSLKNFLFPPVQTVLESVRSEGGWEMRVPRTLSQPLAVIGPRACDLAALRLQDRIFLEGEYIDTAYQARRAALFIVAVNCRRAAATCFCHSMQTGPAVSSGFDLALTELEDYFTVQVGSDSGADAILQTDWSPCSIADIETARQLPRGLELEMARRSAGGESEEASGREAAAQGEAASDRKAPPRQRSLNTAGVRELLLDNLEHPQWEQVAQRCLACANCTMVCPTCFCSAVEEVADLTGDHVTRRRSWDSCFTADHSYMNSGAVHKTTRSRYRQWLTHKLATWHDQFGASGCTGCGRCITWCPVGIDLTEEVAAIRRTAASASGSAAGRDSGRD